MNLMGGTGMLARVPSTRATRDIDLYRRGFTLTQALDDLIRLAAIDLGDHFRFQYVSHTQAVISLVADEDPPAAVFDAEFLKEQGKIPEVLADYGPYVNPAYAKAAASATN